MAWNPLRKPIGTRARIAERHEAHGLHCGIGDLVDLSASGMRVIGKGKCAVTVGARVPLVVSNDGQCVRVTGLVVWLRKPPLGNGAYQFGVRFVDVRPGIAAALEQLAEFGCINTQSIGGGAAPDASTGSTGGTAGAPAPSRVEIENLYSNLGVTTDATDADIKRAFHALALKFHPDRNKDDNASQQFATINKSYMVLKDTDARRRYDNILKRSA